MQDGEYTFSKFLIFCLKTQVLSLVADMVESKRQLNFINFWEHVCQIQSLINHICLSVIFSRENSIPWKKWPVQSTAQSHKRPPLRQLCCFDIYQTYLMHSPHFVTQNSEKTASWHSRFNKINHFCCFVKGTFSPFFFFSLLECRVWRIQGLLMQGGVTGSICAKTPANLPTLVLNHQSKCQRSEKKSK